MITRRNFITLAGAPFVTTLLARNAVAAHAKKPLDGPEIKSISIFSATGNFYRFVGMNSYDKAPKGINGSRPVVKITLTDGTHGIGVVGYRVPDENALMKLRTLIGKNPLTFYDWNSDKISGVTQEMQTMFYNPTFAWFESAVLDAIGRLKGLPVWKLYGQAVRDGLDAYDGTLYFEDIAQNRDVGIIAEIAQKIKADGYRAIKIKLGRPSKWLVGEAGVQRDIEAFIALREAVGSNFILMADANNGYAGQFDWALRLLSACAPYNMHFIEELFPDDETQYRKLRAKLMEMNSVVPIAEGESITDLTQFDSYLTSGVYSYLQPDMHTCGFSNILAFARRAERFPHVKVIPHVWQSQVGLIMSLHAAKIQRNIPHVEDSRYVEHSILPQKFLFREGQWFVGDQPGWGIEFTPDYKQFMTSKETIVQ